MPIARMLAAALLCAALLATPAVAATLTYKGKATSTDGTFKYGKVTVRIANGTVTKIEIQSVTTSGCGGFMTVVYSKGYPGSKITKGSPKVRSGKFNFTYMPTTDVEDQTTLFKGTVTKSRVTGTFKSGVLCGNAGKYTARR